MKRTIRMWVALGAGVTAGALPALPALPALAGQQSDGVMLAQAAGEAGESATAPAPAAAGEAGESGAEDGLAGDVAAIANMAFIEGHLRAALALHAAGRTDMALAHLQSPDGPLYRALVEEFSEHGADGFAEPLVLFSQALKAGAPVADAQTQLDAVVAGITGTAITGIPDYLGPAMHAIAAKIAEEYAEGVSGGAVTQVEPYQTAWGIREAAMRLLRALPDDELAEYNGAFGKMLALLEGASAAWPDITGEAPPGADPSVLAGLAARIEIAGLAIRPE